MPEAHVVAAYRTAVAPRNGALKSCGVHELAAPLIAKLLAETGVAAERVDRLILGNALYGGGNPARLAGLAAGLGEALPAMTVDTQCCAGMDALALAAQAVRSGDCDIVVAGGAESYTRAPRRFARAVDGGPDVEYRRPPFTPWPDADPDMIRAAADLAESAGLNRADQEAYAVASHRKAIAGRDRMRGEIVPVDGVDADAFARRLTKQACQRLPVMEGGAAHGLTAATIAVEADAAALCLVVGDGVMRRRPDLAARGLRVLHAKSLGADPRMPALAPVRVCVELLREAGLTVGRVDVAEIMEAFASQAMICIRDIGLADSRVNRGGGGLARGHPIGASGAINVVRLFHEMDGPPDAGYGLATIAGAGGLGAAMLLARS